MRVPAPLIRDTHGEALRGRGRRFGSPAAPRRDLSNLPVRALHKGVSLLNYGSRLVEGIFLVGRTYRVIESSPVRRSTSRGYLACRTCRWDIEPEEVHMRKVVAAEFLSLDGVMEAPDKWHFPYFNEEMGQAVEEGFAAADAMLMGRVNYEEWAAFWPGQDPEVNPMAAQMNSMQKYVVSTTLEEPLSWQNSTLIGEDVGEEIGRLKQGDGGDIVISGSGALVRSLLQYGLLDELKLMIHPVVVGGGKRLFEDFGEHKALELVDSQTFATGVVYLTYRPA